MVRMLRVFKGCKEIELMFYIERQCREDIPDDLEENLFKVLSSAKELERLSLSFGIDIRLVNFRAPFDTIFESNYIWLHLQGFNIAGFGIKDHDLLEFLKYHRMTLRKVSIMNCELYTSYWCVVVKAMKETLQLTSFEMGSILLDSRDFYSAGEIQEMKDYVLCVGEWVRPFSRQAGLTETQIWRGSPSVQG